MNDLLRLVAYIVAGLIGVSWGLAVGMPLTVGTVLAVMLMAVLPDFLTLLGNVAHQPQIERVAHSLWVVLLLGLLNLIVPVPGGWLGVAAYGAHLLVDALTDSRGVPLLWPLSAKYFYLASLTSSFERLALVVGLGLLLALPHLSPRLTQDMGGLFQAESEVVMPNTITVKVPHVYTLDEILVKSGDVVEAGDILADLATYRRLRGQVDALPPTPTSTLTPTPTPTKLPTSTLTPTPTPTWEVNKLTAARAWADLELARSVATATAAPPNATRVFEVCNEVELLYRKLWRDQIARDMAKAAEMAWEVIHIQEIDLEVLEGDIATAAAECALFENFTQNPDEFAVQMAAAKVGMAEIEYQLLVSTPTPRLEKPPTSTRTPSPTKTTTPTKTPTPTPIATPANDDSRIYAMLDGYILDVRLTAATGNEATVEIVMIPQGQDETPLVQGSDKLDATVVRAVDGDTIIAQIGGVEETVRLIGVDTPETKHPSKGVECFGYEAANYTRALLPPGQEILIEFDSERRDKYGRYLAYVWLGQDMVNQTLVKEGYARPLTIRPNNRHAATFDKLADEAQAKGRGLWGACL